ncbi:MAG: hypothetical protein RLZ66_936, partial [Pseudomonadota bacterium]
LEPLLYEPLPAMAAPLVKWSTEVTRLQDLPRTLRRAAKVAMSYPLGPVFISLPGDILNEAAELDMGRRVRIDPRVRPSDDAVRELAQTLLTAKNPVLITGQELAAHDCFQAATELADILGAAVFQESIPYSATFPTAHPQYLGMLTRSQENVQATLAPYDLVVCLGADLLRMSVYSPTEPLPAHSRVVHISERAWELGKNYPTEVAVCANVRDTLAVLLPALRALASPAFIQSVAERKAQLSQDNWTTRRAKAVKTVMASQATVQPITPANLIWRITEHLPSDAIVVEEALTSTQPLPQFLHQRDPSSWFGLASGGLGFAIPGAVGISLAKPGRPVVAIVGDGSAMYGIQGLWTAAHLKLPITYVIANNRGYRIIKERLVSMQGSNRFIGMDIREPDIQFATLAQSMGLQATQITDPQDLGDALKAAMASGRPNLIEVFVADGFGT